MKTYGTILEALEDLQQQGYTHDFNLRQGCIYCQQEERSFLPHEFELLEVHRFEEMSDLAESAAVYVISSPMHGLKGTLVDAYGIYSEEASGAFLAKID